MANWPLESLLSSRKRTSICPTRMLSFSCGIIFWSDAKPDRSRAGWRRNFQSVFLSNLYHARNVLLLLRTEHTNFLEEHFKARRRDDAHEPTGRLTEVTVGVRYPARRKN